MDRIAMLLNSTDRCANIGIAFPQTQKGPTDSDAPGSSARISCRATHPDFRRSSELRRKAGEMSSAPASPSDELLEVSVSALLRENVTRQRESIGRRRRWAVPARVEQSIASEFSAEHRLKAPQKIGVSVTLAEEELRRRPCWSCRARGVYFRLPRCSSIVPTSSANGPITLKAPPPAKARPSRLRTRSCSVGCPLARCAPRWVRRVGVIVSLSA